MFITRAANYLALGIGIGCSIGYLVDHKIVIINPKKVKNGELKSALEHALELSRQINNFRKEVVQVFTNNK
jgi:hypothetical protein